MEVQTAKRLKCVVVGEATVGKTHLLVRFTTNVYEDGDYYVPTVFDTYSVDLDSAVGPISLDLFDTAGNEGYEDLRVVAYNNTDIFLLCFAVNNLNSFYSIEKKWYQEIKRSRPKATIILVGTKSDLRKSGQGVVRKQQIEKLQQKLKLKYVECSSLTGENVKEVFSEGMQEAILGELNDLYSNNSLYAKIKRMFCCLK